MPRLTKQKKMLHEEIKLFSSFFDAQELHQKLSGKHQKFGLATIYRFLNKAESDGDLHSFLCHNKKIYSNNKKSHAHFTCERCGKLKHIPLKNVDFLQETLPDEICHFQVELVGICSGCKQK